MAKIFLSFYNAIRDISNPAAMPAFYECFIEGLKAAGNDLFVYSFNNINTIQQKIPTLLKKKIKDFDPELVILFNNAFYDISEIVECPIIVYEVDSVLYYHHKETLKKKPNRFSFFINQKDSYNSLSDLLNIPTDHIYLVPPFSSVRSEPLPIRNNISFIGSKFTQPFWKSSWNYFQESKPSAEEKEQFLVMLKSIREDPFQTEQVILKRFGGQSEKIQQNLDLTRTIFSLSDRDRIQVLSEVADIGLELFGTNNWASDLSYDPILTLSYNPQKVYSLKHNQDIYNASKICININHIQALNAFSWRVCDIMASNACIVTMYQPVLKEFFPDIEIPQFTNRYEAREQCIRILNNENQRLDIVARCQEIIDARYRFHHLQERIQEILSVNLSEPNRKDTQLTIESEYSVNNQFIDRWKSRLIMYAACLLLIFPLTSIPCPFLKKRKWGVAELFQIIYHKYQTLNNQ